MNISQREIGMSLLTLGLVLGAAGWYLVDHKTEAWKAMADESVALEQQILLHRNAIDRQTAWADELEHLQQQLPVFAIDQTSVAPELVKTIKQLASQHGVDILRTTPYKETTIGDLFEVGINCTWESSLEELVGFLTVLQQQGVRYDTRSINITPAGKNSTDLKGSMIIHCAFTRPPTPNTAP